MCRLFGLVANKPVDLRFSMFEAPLSFVKQAMSNPHGWGIAYYENNKVQVKKEPLSAAGSVQFQQRAMEAKSSIVLAHVRKASVGGVAYENTHPFSLDNWAFAHNGSISNYKEFFRGRIDLSKVKGNDSDCYFHWIVQNIEKSSDLIEGIRQGVKEIIENASFTGLNFLLTNSKFLCAFRYACVKQNYYSLFYLERDPREMTTLHHLSKITSQLIESKRLAGEKAVIIASEKVTDEAWQEIKMGELVVVDRDLNIEKHSLCELGM